MTASESAGFKVKILDIASPSRISVRLPRMEEEYFSLTNEMNIHPSESKVNPDIMLEGRIVGIASTQIIS